MRQYQPATFRDGVTVAKNIRKEDLQEIRGLGFDLVNIPVGVLTSEHATVFYTREGVVAGCAGVNREEGNVGRIWMLCTEAIHKEPITFVRQAKSWLRDIENDYRLLWNLADARNHVHHKLLRHLGFKALRAVPIGDTNYYEIVRLCV
jgi:hypothetical protein